jgi:hypothetical protein
MNNKISANLQNDIMKVLRGETKVEIPLPNAIINAARTAAAELKQLSLTEGYLSAESKKQVLRKNLNEGLEKCGCSPTTNMIARYEEEAMKPVAEEEPKQLEENKKTTDSSVGEKKEDAEVLDESSDMMLRSWIRNNYPKADNAKFNKIYAAMKKQHSKDPQGYTRGGGFGKVAKDAKIKEMFEETEISEELKNLVDSLSEEDRNVLRELLGNQTK